MVMVVVLNMMKVADSMFLSTSTTAWFEAVCKAFYCCLTTLTPHNLCEAGGTNTSEALPYPQPYPIKEKVQTIKWKKNVREGSLKMDIFHDNCNKKVCAFFVHKPIRGRCMKY